MIATIRQITLLEDTVVKKSSCCYKTNIPSNQKCEIVVIRTGRAQGLVKALVLSSAMTMSHGAVNKTNDAVYQVV